LKDQFFLDLKGFFQKFHQSFDVKTSGICGDCHYCCSSRMKFPSLYPLERDFIASYIEGTLIPISLKEFEDFLFYRNLPVCPFHIKSSGCSIYNARPLFCRIFGQVETHMPHPDCCIYCNNFIKYGGIKEFLEEYKILNLAYTKYKLSICEKENDKINLMIEMGIEYLSLDGLSEAYEIFSQLLKHNSADVMLLYNLGITCLRMQYFEEALKYFYKVLEIDTTNNHSDIYDKIAYSYYELNQLQKASDFYDKAIALAPDNITAHIGKLNVYLKLHKIDDFKRRLKRVLRRFPYEKDLQEFVKFSK